MDNLKIKIKYFTNEIEHLIILMVRNLTGLTYEQPKQLR